jgi:hypothetical protein
MVAAVRAIRRIFEINHTRVIVATAELIPVAFEARRRVIGSLRKAKVSDAAPIFDYSVDIMEAAKRLAGTLARIGDYWIEQQAMNQLLCGLIAPPVAAVEALTSSSTFNRDRRMTFPTMVDGGFSPTSSARRFALSNTQAETITVRAIFRQLLGLARRTH